MDDIYSGLAGRMDTRLIGCEINYYPALSSTMDVAREKGLSGDKEGLVIVAGQQTGGRGRQGRTWFSPEGSLALSILCYPEKSWLSELVMCGSLSILDTIEQYGVKEAGIKWPNDVLIGGRKVAGVLIESRVLADTVIFAVIGMGININSNMTGFREMLIAPASLAVEVGRAIDAQGFFHHLMENTDRLYCGLKSGNSLLDQWKSRLVTLGREVSIMHGPSFLRGLARDVTPEGSLLLETESGEEVIISAGDVILEQE